jgi:hypothetical protein
MKYTCPVCFFSKLPYPPRDYHICPCCGTEFGNDDADSSYDQLREMWVAGGANWFFGKAPEGWNPWLQLIKDGRGAFYALPHFQINLSVQANAIVEHVAVSDSVHRLSVSA